MMIQQHSRREGSGILGIVFALIIVSAVGAIGYGVYTAYQTQAKKAAMATSGQTPPVNPISSWKTYTSVAGKYSLRHPTGWFEDTCDSGSDDLTLYLGTTKAGRVVCNSEHGSQIIIVSTTAVPTESEQQLGDIYSDQAEASVAVDGITGKRQSGKLNTAEFGMPVGTSVVRYFFLTPGRSYIAAYLQTPTGDYATDNLATFDQIIQTTLKFTK